MFAWKEAAGTAGRWGVRECIQRAPTMLPPTFVLLCAACQTPTAAGEVRVFRTASHAAQHAGFETGIVI